MKTITINGMKGQGPRILPGDITVNFTGERPDRYLYSIVWETWAPSSGVKRYHAYVQIDRKLLDGDMVNVIIRGKQGKLIYTKLILIELSDMKTLISFVRSLMPALRAKKDSLIVD
jgi:hypothetical protein